MEPARKKPERHLSQPSAAAIGHRTRLPKREAASAAPRGGRLRFTPRRAPASRPAGGNRRAVPCGGPPARCSGAPGPPGAPGQPPHLRAAQLRAASQGPAHARLVGTRKLPRGPAAGAGACAAGASLARPLGRAQTEAKAAVPLAHTSESARVPPSGRTPHQARSAPPPARCPHSLRPGPTRYFLRIFRYFFLLIYLFPLNPGPRQAGPPAAARPPPPPHGHARDLQPPWAPIPAGARHSAGPRHARLRRSGVLLAPLPHPDHAEHADTAAAFAAPLQPAASRGGRPPP